MGDAADRADMEIELATADALQRHHERQRLIAQSMTPYVPGQTRDCKDCGVQIASARVAALPHASQCVDCATAYEAKMRVNYGHV